MNDRDLIHEKKVNNNQEEGDKLREVELRYYAIFEHSPYGILLIDMNGAIIDFNESAHRQLGYSREEFAKLSISDIDPFESPDEIKARITKVLKEGKAEFEVRHRTKGGEIRDVHVITQAMDLSGRVVFQTIWNDITEQKRAEEELKKYRERLEELVEERTGELKRVNEQLQKDIADRETAEEALLESEKRYRMLYESAGDAIFILDTEGGKAGQIISANKAAADMHGYTAGELLTLNIRDLDTLDAAKDAPKRIERMLKGEWLKTEMTHRKKDGTVFPVEVNAGLLELENHKYILAFDREITERKLAEQEREELVLNLQEALDNVKTLRGLLPICAWCKKVHDDKGYWKKVETYIEEHSDALFTHSMCPECLKKKDPELYEKLSKDPELFTDAKK